MLFGWQKPQLLRIALLKEHEEEMEEATATKEINLCRSQDSYIGTRWCFHMKWRTKKGTARKRVSTLLPTGSGKSLVKHRGA